MRIMSKVYVLIVCLAIFILLLIMPQLSVAAPLSHKIISLSQSTKWNSLLHIFNDKRFITDKRFTLSSQYDFNATDELTTTLKLLK